MKRLYATGFIFICTLCICTTPAVGQQEDGMTEESYLRMARERASTTHPSEVYDIVRTIQLDEALDVVKGLEKGYKTMSWESDSLNVRYSDPFDLSAGIEVIDDNLVFQKRVLLDDGRNDFRVDTIAVLEWHRGNGDIVYRSSHDRFTKIDETYTLLEQGKPQILETFENSDFEGGLSLGTITSDPADYLRIANSLKSGSARYGYGAIPGYFNDFVKATRFSYFIEKLAKEDRLISIGETSDGVWLFTANDRAEGQKKFRELFIEYRPDRGGCVTKALWGLPGGDEYEFLVERYYEVELEELSDGQWFPKSFSSVWPLDASGTVIAFSNGKVNPDIADEAWVFDFPDGTRVEDYVSGYYYIMGEAFDQDKRVNEFMVRHNLKGDAPSRESKSTVSSFRVAMLLVAVAPLLLVVLWVIKRRKVG